MTRYFLLAVLFVGCGYKHYHKPVKVNQSDSSYLDRDCVSIPADTINCITATSYHLLQKEFIQKNEGYTGLLLFEAGCVGFYSAFYKRKAAIDSIEGFDYRMVSIDDYKSIPFIRRQLRKLDIREDIWILDEQVYGRF